MNPHVQSRKANERFIADQLNRYGTAREALKAARRLRDMAPDGHPWWTYIVGKLAVLTVDPSLDPRLPHVTIVEGK